MNIKQHFSYGWRYGLAGLTLSSAGLLAANAQSGVNAGTNSLAATTSTPASHNV